MDSGLTPKEVLQEKGDRPRHWCPPMGPVSTHLTVTPSHPVSEDGPLPRTYMDAPLIVT